MVALQRHELAVSADEPPAAGAAFGQHGQHRLDGLVEVLLTGVGREDGGRGVVAFPDCPVSRGGGVQGQLLGHAGRSVGVGLGQRRQSHRHVRPHGFVQVEPDRRVGAVLEPGLVEDAPVNALLPPVARRRAGVVAVHRLQVCPGQRLPLQEGLHVVRGRGPLLLAQQLAEDVVAQLQVAVEIRLERPHAHWRLGAEGVAHAPLGVEVEEARAVLIVAVGVFAVEVEDHLSHLGLAVAHAVEDHLGDELDRVALARARLAEQRGARADEVARRNEYADGRRGRGDEHALAEADRADRAAALLLDEGVDQLLEHRRRRDVDGVEVGREEVLHVAAEDNSVAAALVIERPQHRHLHRAPLKLAAGEGVDFR